MKSFNLLIRSKPRRREKAGSSFEVVCISVFVCVDKIISGGSVPFVLSYRPTLLTNKQREKKKEVNAGSFGLLHDDDDDDFFLHHHSRPTLSVTCSVQESRFRSRLSFTSSKKNKKTKKNGKRGLPARGGSLNRNRNVIIPIKTRED